MLNLENIEQNKAFMKKIIGAEQLIKDEGDIYDLPFSELIKILEDLSSKGNEQLKINKDYEKASSFYAKALIHFYYIIPQNDEEAKELNPIKLNCHLNQALWFYAKKRFNEGLSECHRALSLDPSNVVGLYRRALLHRAKQNYEKAINDIK